MIAAAVLVGLAFVAARWSRPVGRTAPAGGPGDDVRTLGRAHGVDELIAVLDAAAQGCRAGLGLGPACADAEARIGIAMPVLGGEAALDADDAVVAHAVAVAREFGGPMALVLDSAATVLRERRAMRAIRAAHTAAARLSARVLTALPLLFTAFNSVVSESARRVLFGSAAGITCLALGMGLNITGWCWMRLIIRERP